MNFRKRDFLKTLQPEDYTLGSKEECLGTEWDDVDIDEIENCLIYRTAANTDSERSTTISLLFDQEGTIIGLIQALLLSPCFKPN